MAPENPYQTLLGDGWEGLAPGVRMSHTCPLRATGVFEVFRAERGMAGFVARLLSLPPTGREVQVSLSLEPSGSGVRWSRTFGSRLMNTLHTFRRKQLLERSGPFAICLAIHAEDDCLVFRQTGLQFLGIPLPLRLGLLVLARVSPGDDANGWRSEVDIRHSLLGNLCRYHGMMRAE